LEVVSPKDGKQLIMAAHVSFAVMIIAAVAIIFSILGHKE
jgi:hypothetical protein